MPTDSFEDAFERQHVAVEEFARGNTEPFKELYSRRADATLANPFGGVARGWDEILSASIAPPPTTRTRRSSGIERSRHTTTATWGSGWRIERIRGRVGGRDDVVVVALRTTTVYRREDTEWRLVHRHADPAVELRSPEAIVS